MNQFEIPLTKIYNEEPTGSGWSEAFHDSTSLRYLSIIERNFINFKFEVYIQEIGESTNILHPEEKVYKLYIRIKKE